ncbi:hypothetical protein FRB93_011437 [Tulasnella sp. JGI-2019a]|nr:hypothetical protein FRB93_011437 [Tulasnella sp. JGI-2019a]
MSHSVSFNSLEVFVDLPHYPHKALHYSPRPKATDLKNKRPLVPVVEIPPLKSSKGVTATSYMNVAAPTTRPRGLPLKDKNIQDATVPSPAESSKAAQKRKQVADDESVGGKKQRVNEGENEGPNSVARGLEKNAVTASDPFNIARASRGIIRKVVAPPSPRWMPIRHADTKEAIENRMILREFFHRFASLLKFPKTHRDTLDEFAHLSDQTAKAMLVSLVDLLLADANEEDQESFRSAKTELRKAGLSPTQLWSTLETLRADIPNLKIGNPGMVEVRASNRRGSGVRVASSTQLIPCILSLIDIALEGPSIYDDIAEGLEACRKARAKCDEAIKVEREIWGEKKADWNKLRDEKIASEEAAKAQLKEGHTLKDDEKFDLKGWRSKYKMAETAHKMRLKTLRLSLIRESTCDQLRFAPAGTDLEGRTYYILSAPPKGVKAPNDESRELMDRWAWIVSVHNPTAGNAEGPSTAWYGFHDPQDIRILTKWLAWTGVEAAKKAAADRSDSGVVLEPRGGLSASRAKAPSATLTIKAPTAPPGITKLCKDLDEFAEFLDWACPKKGKLRLGSDPVAP